MERLNKLSEELAEKKAILNSKIEEVRAGAEDDATDVADVQAGMEEVKQLKAEVETLTGQIETINEALDLEPESEQEAPAEDATEPAEDATEPEDKRDGEDIEIPDDTEEETRSGKDITNMEAVIGKQNSAFEDFLKSGEVRDGLTTVEGAVVIPKEILDIQKVPNDPTQLASYVNRVAVTSGVGSLPVLAKNTARLASTAELAENPELAKLSLKGVDYKALTYRGVLPVSMEMLQDAPEIESIVSDYVSEAKALTEQYKIGEVLQKAAAVTVSDVDGIKDAFNKGLSNYNRMFVVSESFFAEIDKIKDADGRYLLQDSITSPSGKQLLGASVVVVADDVLGKAGEAHAFVGDVKAFALEAMRSDIAVEWQDDDIFGKKLAVALRADWQVADAQAGKFLTFAPAAAPAK
ncbi:phage major capsid protein [Weissella confusa]|uniref:phage major capsid protein n=1 Tax=Weissella confusa TaxID=1583 RepID=UPI00108117C3|nr:phage major capsid protein [Weissella confusa]TGE52986.1 phage major capsid protein [Weissella confusa]TGE59909.1 phage major capsid protein [Weissella confusa]